MFRALQKAMHAFSECRPYRTFWGLRAIQFGLLDYQIQAEREKRGFALSPQALAMLDVGMGKSALRWKWSGLLSA